MPEPLVNALHGVLGELDQTVREWFIRHISEEPPQFPLYTAEIPWPEYEGGGFLTHARVGERDEVQPAPVRNEGEATPTQKFPTRRVKDIYPIMFRTSFDASHERRAMGPKKSNSVQDVGKDIADSLRMSVEAYFAQMLSEADTTSDVSLLSFDEQPWASTAHVLADSSTTSNIYSTTSSVTYSTLHELISLIRRTPSQGGNPLVQFKLTELWIPVEEESNALETLKSVGRPDTANRADNVLSSRSNSSLGASSLKVVDWMTPDRWFAVDGTRFKLYRYMLEPPFVESGVEEVKKNLIYRWYGRAWIARAVKTWRGSYMVNRP